MALAGASASPAADPALLYTGVPAVGGVVAPVVGTVDTGLKFHPASGAVTPDFTEAQKEAAPELAANQKDIKHLAYTGHVVQPNVLHTGAYLYGKRDAEPAADADPKSDAYLMGYGYGLPTVYGGYPYGGVYHTYGKRDAEAKSDAYLGYGYGLPAVYGGYPYGGVYHTYGKRDAEAKSDAYLGYGYGLPAVYGGYPYGGVYHTYGKRDAEAKSDAYLGYGYGLPTVYTGYPYGGVYHYGKRDAEAKSDAWGYGLPVYTGYPYAYGGVYGYGK